MDDGEKSIAQEVEEISNACGMKNLPAVQEWCPTGCTVLDIAIANRFPGGIPLGRIVHVFGGTSTCKTVLGTTVCGYAQRAGRHAYYGDVEHTLDPAFAEIYGLDCSDKERFKIGYPQTLEELFDAYIADIIVEKKAKRKGDKDKLDARPKIIVVDSITALPTAVELTEEMKKDTYGTSRARQMSRGLRKYIFFLAESNTTLFCIDQTRDNINAGLYGKQEVTSGGRALEFYSSVQIYLRIDSKIRNAAEKVIGNWIKFRIDKNKVGPPLREGRFKILYSYGLDDIGTSLYFLSEEQNGKEKAKKATTTIKFLDEEHTLRFWTKRIEEDGLEGDLRKEVWKLWQEVYKTEERKVRKW